MKRIVTVAFAAVAAVGFAAEEASAVHITLEAEGQGTAASPIEGVITRGTAPAVVELGDPLIFFGEVVDEDRAAASFVHEFNFGFDTTGEGGASATPNVLEVAGGVQAGFQSFTGNLQGPNLPADGLELTREEPPLTPRLRRIFADFDAVDTSGDANPTPYSLTISGQLLEGVTAGNYSGNAGVVPLPAAGLLFLTAMGSLVLVRRFRSRNATADA